MEGRVTYTSSLPLLNKKKVNKKKVHIWEAAGSSAPSLQVITCLSFFVSHDHATLGKRGPLNWTNLWLVPEAMNPPIFGDVFLITIIFTSWWLNQPIRIKIWSSNCFPQVGVKINNCLKPPASSGSHLIFSCWRVREVTLPAAIIQHETCWELDEKSPISRGSSNSKPTYN